MTSPPTGRREKEAVQIERGPAESGPRLRDPNWVPNALGPLFLRRLVKTDGRALMLFEHPAGDGRGA